MHYLCGAKNRINRARLNTFGAADTLSFPYPCDDRLLFYAVLCIEWLRFYIKQVSQRLNGLLTAWRALVNGIAVGDRLGVGATPRVSALTTLGLR